MFKFNKFKNKVIVVENSENIKLQENLERRYKNVRCILAKTNLGYAKIIIWAFMQKPLCFNFNQMRKSKKIIDNFLNEKNKKFFIMGPAQQDEFNKENFEDKKIFEVERFAMFLNQKNLKKQVFLMKIFIYLEEIDLCKRLIKKNKKICLKNINFIT